MKPIALFFSHHASAGIKNVRIWISFLAGLGICLYNIAPYYAFSKQIREPVQLFEPYIILGSDITFLMSSLLGCLVFLVDAPFLTPLSAYEMVRLGRVKWFWGQTVCLIFYCFAYSVFIFIGVSVVTRLHSPAFPANEWSRPMEILAIRQPDYVIVQHHFAFDHPDLVMTLRPLSVVLRTILFNSLYTVCIGCSILVFNLLLKRQIGLTAALALHFLGYLIYQDIGLGIPLKYSLLCCASPAFQAAKALQMPPAYCLAVFAVIILALLNFCRPLVASVEI